MLKEGRKKIAQWLVSVWYDKSSTFLTISQFALYPFSVLYRYLLKVRTYLYRVGIWKITYLRVPVVVVGNLTVGGAGKTPLTLFLANYLMNRGYRVGILSRGYQGKYTGAYCQVFPESAPAWVGDEAVLLAKQVTCPVVVSRQRVQGGLFLQNQMGCTVILSDDGLQHTALGRQIEILVMDGLREFGNQQLLPAGPLREPLSRISSVDFLVTQGPIKSSRYKGQFFMQLIPDGWVSLKNSNLKFPNLEGLELHAMTGIGNPDRFFEQVEQLLTSKVRRHVFPDHYLFKQEDFKFSKQALILMTEKDAVKCMHFADERFWYLQVKISLDPEFPELFIAKLDGIVNSQKALE